MLQPQSNIKAFVRMHLKGCHHKQDIAKKNPSTLTRKGSDLNSQENRDNEELITVIEES